jgi:hypothetical protein
MNAASSGWPTAGRCSPATAARIIRAVTRGDARFDRSCPVLELALGLEQVGRPGAVAEPAVVEHEREATVLREALRQRAKAVAARAREPVRHHDDRPGLPLFGADGRVHPSRARVARHVEVQTCLTDP